MIDRHKLQPVPVRTANRVITRKAERGSETLPLCEACGERRESWEEGKHSLFLQNLLVEIVIQK